VFKHNSTRHPRRERQGLPGSAVRVAILLLLCFLLSLPYSPRFYVMSPDSGLFAYGGQQILSGRLLYRDFWDHKPPAVYYLDAVAMWVGGQSPWSVWWLQVAWLAAIAITFLRVSSRLTGPWAGMAGSLLLLLTTLHPAYYIGGNLTESYALLPQMLALGAVGLYLRKHHPVWIVAAGLATACAFLFKQTYVALGMGGIIIVAYSALREGGWRPALGRIGWFMAGFAVPLALVVGYWGSRGALADMWDATVTYNLAYGGQGISVQGAYGVFRAILVAPPLSMLGALGLAGWLVFLFQNRGWLVQTTLASPPIVGVKLHGTEMRPWQAWTLAAVAVALPLELLLLIPSGRLFGHYFMTPIPTLAMLAGYLLSQLGVGLLPLRELRAHHVGAVALTALLLVSWSVEVAAKEMPTREQLGSLRLPLSGEYLLDGLSSYVIDHTQVSDRVLVWGIHADVNFLTGRRLPSRYPYATHLFYERPGGRSRFEEFLEGLRRDPPSLIFAQEVSSAGVPYFGVNPATGCSECGPMARNGLVALAAFVEEEYSLVDRIGDWIVFRRNQP
jgi:hypothetical protein